MNESQRATGAVEIVSEQQADGSYELKLQSKELHLPEGGLRPTNRTGSSRGAQDGGSATWIGLLAVAALLVVGGYLLFVSPQGDERDPLADTPSATVGGPRVGSLRPPPAPNPAPRAILPGGAETEFDEPNEAAAVDLEGEALRAPRRAYEAEEAALPGGFDPEDERSFAAVRGARPTAAPASGQEPGEGSTDHLDDIDRFDDIDRIGAIDRFDDIDPVGEVDPREDDEAARRAPTDEGEDELQDEDEFEEGDEYDDEEEFVDDDEFEEGDEYDDEEEFVDDEEFED